MSDGFVGVVCPPGRGVLQCIHDLFREVAHFGSQLGYRLLDGSEEDKLAETGEQPCDTQAQNKQGRWRCCIGNDPTN